MELYASGWNAHGQLISSPDDPFPKDLSTFQKIASGTHIRLHCAVWSATVLEIDDVLYYRGFHASKAIINAEISGLPTSRIKTVFGNNSSGILGALTKDGEVWILGASESGSLVFVKHEFSPDSCWADIEMDKINHIAVADNEQVCLCTCPPSSPPPFAKAANDVDAIPMVFAFPSFSSFLSSSHPTAMHPLPRLEPISLLASTTSFTALSLSFRYQVHTWGDARHSHLGRDPSDWNPASSPSALWFVNDRTLIEKIATKGWLSAVLNEEGDLYIWGGRPGEKEREIAVHPLDEDPLTGESETYKIVGVRLVDVEEGADVRDVGVGDGWVLVLTASRKVWGWGNGRWGQLGLGRKTEWQEGWTEINCREWEGKGKMVVGVECGYWNSFVLVEQK